MPQPRPTRSSPSRAHRRAAAAALLLALAAPGAAGAQGGPRADAAKDGAARIERVADGVWVILHADATRDWPSGTTEWPHGNTGVVAGEEGVLVVDATYYPSRARADIALIRSVTDRPVRWLVNTHWHGDHIHGNAEYRDAFPGITIVGARPNRHFVELNAVRYPKNAVAPGSALRARLDTLEAWLARGRDSTGRALSAEQRRGLAENVRERKIQLAELAAVRPAPPTLLFDRDLALELGGRRVELRNWDRANSPADVTVHVPDARVLFAGDALVHPVPYAWGSFPGPWIDVLRGLEAIPVTALVPGHGPVLRDHAYTRQVRELFEAARDRTAALLREGKTLEQVQAGVDLSDLRPRFVREGDASAGVFWDDSIAKALVERMYQCVVGYRC
jgi:glyoxylase-like metal-dependent hydrolase (beta-lactamase superfamily II)